MFGVSIKAILVQLKRDLIGKDSHRGVTLTYAWLANQFGHFALGFIPTLILYNYLLHHALWHDPEFWAASIISGFWIAFEAYNYFAPLLSRSAPKDHSLFTGGPEYIFEPRWWYIAFDTITDITFFVMGSFVCASFLQPLSLWNVVMAAASFFLLMYPVAYWFTSKVYLMNAGFPMQFNLSLWNYCISAENKQKVDHFIRSEDHQHLLIFGSRTCGKSELAIGIASKLATQTKRKKCTYYTGIKLYSKFYQKKRDFKSEFLWDWNDCDCLIIDDINCGNPVPTDQITPEEFLSYVMNDEFKERNVQLLNSRKVIWVMGETLPYDDGSAVSNWRSMVKSLGVKGENAVVITLP